mmetsp:Transcript_51377/g.94054  ORF Transcript_51377/g.94054 Transcript_51377/m.94054 type:complete len:87 (+) Transcript_51377:132-392(+)
MDNAFQKLRKLFPCWCQLCTMTAPWGVKLQEPRLVQTITNVRIKIRSSELNYCAVEAFHKGPPTDPECSAQCNTHPLRTPSRETPL